MARSAKHSLSSYASKSGTLKRFWGWTHPVLWLRKYCPGTMRMNSPHIYDYSSFDNSGQIAEVKYLYSFKEKELIEWLEATGGIVQQETFPLTFRKMHSFVMDLLKVKIPHTSTSSQQIATGQALIRCKPETYSYYY